MEKETARNVRRSIVSNAETLDEANKILIAQGSSISSFCHLKLRELINENEAIVKASAKKLAKKK